jgi:hypothetical protein
LGAGNASLGAGYGSLGAGNASLGAGYGSLGAGNASLGAGYGSLGAGNASLGAGYGSLGAGNASLGAGYGSLNAGNASLGAGYGSLNAGNASLGAGNASLGAGYGSLNTGNASLGAGYGSLNAGYGSLGAGNASLGAGYGSLNAGYGSLNAGNASLGAGYGSLNAGNASLGAGYGSLNAGNASLGAGYGSLNAGNASLGAGYGSLNAGNASLSASYGSLNAGNASLSASYGSLNAGNASLGAGYGSLGAGYGSLNAGNASLSAGYGSLNAGNASLGAGYGSLVAFNTSQNINNASQYNNLMNSQVAGYGSLSAGYASLVAGLGNYIKLNNNIPILISGCILWLDAADSSTLTFSSGNNVSQWNDKSSVKNNMTQPNSNLQPIFGTMSNGLNSLNFANKKWLQNILMNFPNAPYTVFAVGYGNKTGYGRLLNAVNDGYFFLGADNNGSNYASFVSTGPGSWINGTDVNTPNYDCNNLCIMELTNNGAKGGLIPYFNGNMQNGKNGMTASFTGLTVGRGYTDNDQCWNGYVCEVIIYNSILTTIQRQQVEGYLAWKWSIKSSLPANHPHYLSSPQGNTIINDSQIAGYGSLAAGYGSLAASLGNLKSNSSIPKLISINNYIPILSKQNVNVISNQQNPSQNGTYIVSSSKQSDYGEFYNDYQAFAYTSSNTGYWAVNNASTTLVDSKNITGAWLQIQLPTAIQMTRFTTCAVYNSPKSIVIAGSNDGKSWNTISTIDNLGLPDVGGNADITKLATVDINTNSNYYSYIRFIVTSSNPGRNQFNLGFVNFNCNVLSVDNNELIANLTKNASQNKNIIDSQAMTLANCGKELLIYVYPIDQLSNSAKSSLVGVYSVYLLSSTYAGPIVKIRRSSDNLISDFYADGNGNLGTGSLGTGTNLSTWLNNSTGHVTTWYDQSGKGNNATQTNAEIQPVINITSKLILLSNNSYFNLPNGTVPYDNTPYTVIFKHGNVNSANGGFLGSGDYGSGNRTNAFRRDGNTYVNYWWSNDLIFGKYEPSNIVTINYNQKTQTAFVNNTNVGSRVNITRNSTANKNTIGVTNNTEYLNGEIFYMYISNISLSDPDRLVLETSKFTSSPMINSSLNIDPSSKTSISSTGAVISTIGNYKLYTFTTNGTFVSQKSVPFGPNGIMVLIVGGGGGGGNGANGMWEGCGGGGAGGLGYGSLNIVGNVFYNINVGKGGTQRTNGTASTITGNDQRTETAQGGGYGGGPSNGGNSSSTGSTGGSGGGGNGAGKRHEGGTSVSGSGSLIYIGKNGGFGAHANGGGGGGGAGSSGAGSSSWTGANGGNGFQWPINNQTYAAGGGGGSGHTNGSGGVGGSNIGGKGGDFNGNGKDGSNGAPNTGSGGGGGGAYTGKGGAGSNGIVIFAVPLSLVN